MFNKNNLIKFTGLGFTTLSFAQTKPLDGWKLHDTVKNEEKETQEFIFELPDMQDRLRRTYQREVEQTNDKETGFCLDTAIGYNMSYAHQKKIFGTGARLSVEYSNDTDGYIRADLHNIFDQGSDKDKLDFDRHAMWQKGSLKGARYFENSNDESPSKLLFGIKGCFEGIENSPTSTEHALTLSMAQSTALLDGANTYVLDIGAYTTQFELDDDLPSKRDFGRDQLKVDSLGVLCGISASHKFDNGIILSARARALQKIEGDYSEYNLGTDIELPLSMIFGESCQFWVRGTVEQRYFDLGDRSEALPFENDTFAGIEFVWRAGKRSRLTYGY